MPWDNPATFAPPFAEQDLSRLDPENLRAGVLRKLGPRIGVQQLRQPTPAEQQPPPQPPPGFLANYLDAGRWDRELPPVNPEAGPAPVVPQQPSPQPPAPNPNMVGAGPMPQPQPRAGVPQPAVQPKVGVGPSGQNVEPSLDQIKAMLSPGGSVMPAPPPTSQGQMTNALLSALYAGAQPPRAQTPEQAAGFTAGPGGTLTRSQDGVTSSYSPGHPEAVRQMQQAQDDAARRAGNLPSFMGWLGNEGTRTLAPYERQAMMGDPSQVAKYLPAYQGELARQQLVQGGNVAAGEQRNKLLDTAARIQEAQIQHQGAESKELTTAKNSLYNQTYNQVIATPGGTPEQAHARAMEAVQRYVEGQNALGEMKAGAKVGVQPSGVNVGVQQGSGGATSQVPNATDPAVQALFDPKAGGVISGGKINVPALMQSIPGAMGTMTEAQKAGVAQLLKQQGGGYRGANQTLLDALAERMFESGQLESNGWKLTPQTDVLKRLGAGLTRGYNLTDPKGQQVSYHTFGAQRFLTPTGGTAKAQYQKEIPTLLDLLNRTLPGGN